MNNMKNFKDKLVKEKECPNIFTAGQGQFKKLGNVKPNGSGSGLGSNFGYMHSSHQSQQQQQNCFRDSPLHQQQKQRMKSKTNGGSNGFSHNYGLGQSQPQSKLSSLQTSAKLGNSNQPTRNLSQNNIFLNKQNHQPNSMSRSHLQPIEQNSFGAARLMMKKSMQEQEQQQQNQHMKRQARLNQSLQESEQQQNNQQYQQQPQTQQHDEPMFLNFGNKSNQKKNLGFLSRSGSSSFIAGGVSKSMYLGKKINSQQKIQPLLQAHNISAKIKTQENEQQSEQTSDLRFQHSKLLQSYQLQQQQNSQNNHPTLISSCQFIKSEYGGNDTFQLNGGDNDDREGDNQVRDVDQNEKLNYAKCKSRLRGGVTNNFTKPQPQGNRFYESLDQKVLNNCRQDQRQPTFGGPKYQRRASNDHNLHQQHHNQHRKPQSLLLANQNLTHNHQTSSLTNNNPTNYLMIASTMNPHQNADQHSSQQFHIHSQLMRSCGDYDHVQPSSSVRCINHKNKKAKYRLVAELAQDQDEYFYCSKCAVNVAKQGCFNIEELTEEYIINKTKGRVQEQRFENFKSQQSQSQQQQQYYSHAIADNNRQPQGSLSSMTMNMISPKHKQQHRQHLNLQRQQQLNQFQKRTQNLLTMLEQKLNQINHAANVLQKTAQKCPATSQNNIYDQLIQILTQMKQEQSSKQEISVNSLKLKQVQISRTIEQLQKISQNVKDIAYQTRKQKSKLMLGGVHGSLSSSLMKDSINSSNKGNGNCNPSNTFNDEQFMQRIQQYQEYLKQLDRQEMQRQERERLQESRHLNQQFVDQQKQIEQIFDAMFERLMYPKLDTLRVNNSTNKKPCNSGSATAINAQRQAAITNRSMNSFGNTNNNHHHYEQQQDHQLAHQRVQHVDHHLNQHSSITSSDVNCSAASGASKARGQMFYCEQDDQQEKKPPFRILFADDSQPQDNVLMAGMRCNHDGSGDGLRDYHHYQQQGQRQAFVNQQPSYRKYSKY